MFTLKEYQEQTLEALKTYLEDARLTSDPMGAFERFVASEERTEDYNPIEDIEGVPIAYMWPQKATWRRTIPLSYGWFPQILSDNRHLKP
jgi:hypothetical protein